MAPSTSPRESPHTSKAETTAEAEQIGSQRTQLLCILTVVLVASSLWIHGQTYQGTAQLHALMELLATLIAAFSAVLAYLRYYARRNSSFMFLCLATGLLATSCLDTYHIVISSFLLTSDSLAAATTHWSWNASRFLLATVMIFCWIASRADLKRQTPMFPEWLVYVGITNFTLLLGISFFVLELPSAWFPDAAVSRPLELLSGILFATALSGFLYLKTWRTESFSFWLVCSLLISTTCQLLVMPRSSNFFDADFEWAHLLKTLSYLAILIGLLIDIYQLHRAIDQAAASLDHANHRLRESEERFALASEGSANGLWDWDVQSNQVWYASRFWRMLGYQGPAYPSSVLDSFNRHLHPDDFEKTWAAVDRHLHQGETFDVVYRLKHLSDGYRWFRARGVANHSADGKPVRMSGSIQDITAARQAEHQLKEKSLDLQRSNEELQQFAYVASHDLQEPLRAIAGYGSLLQRFHAEQLSNEGQEYLDFTIDGAKRMQSLINSLLDVSRVRTHGKTFQPIDLNEIVHTASNNLAAQIRETEATVHITNLPVLKGDSSQMIQLFQNLMSNAMKFRQQDQKPHLVIQAEEQSDDWLISISDNGIGIDPQFHNRIFTVFQRLHTREEYSGTGIGLAICKKVVERHRGQIWLESQNGAGSTFYFSISKHLQDQLQSDGENESDLLT
ncbi:MAG: PAS domain-containing protein [Planctomycetaceae bacterium]|nr:PAS domain-containing protein [Planctomycetaceae bacterium]